MIYQFLLSNIVDEKGMKIIWNNLIILTRVVDFAWNTVQLLVDFRPVGMYINSERSDIELQRAIKRYIKGKLASFKKVSVIFCSIWCSMENCYYAQILYQFQEFVERMFNFALTGEIQERKWPVLRESRVAKGIAQALILFLHNVSINCISRIPAFHFLKFLAHTIRWLKPWAEF